MAEPLQGFSDHLTIAVCRDEKAHLPPVLLVEGLQAGHHQKPSMPESSNRQGPFLHERSRDLGIDFHKPHRRAQDPDRPVGHRGAQGRDHFLSQGLKGSDLHD